MTTVISKAEKIY